MRFRDLGVLRIERDGLEVSLGGRKPATILALLLIHLNQRVTVDALVDAVWGDAANATAVSTLESHVFRLRKVLEPDRRRGEPPTVVVNDAGGYRLLANPKQVDSSRLLALAAEVRELINSGDPDRAVRRSEEALGLWRGRPYGEAADQDWAAPAVARLEEAWRQVQELHVEALLASGQADHALIELEVLLPAAPMRERLWEHRMVALYQSGRVDDALAAYRQARTVLLDELGVEPGLDLRRLQQRILASDEALAGPRREVALSIRVRDVKLPRQTAPLLGRHLELEAIGRLVEAHPMVTITGAAGCGKTKLAIETARACAGGFPDGVWFVDLTSIDDPSLAVDVVSSTIGLSPPTVGTALEALSDYARDRRMLVLLDNCEHVIDGVYDLSEELLGDDAAVHLLATSREPVSLEGEVIWSLPPLETPTPGVDGPALELFLARLTAAAPALQLSAEEIDIARAICVDLDGLPLALELAASRIRFAGLAEIAQQVRSNPGGISRPSPGRSEGHRTLRDSIEWSHRLLSPPERVLHRRLSVLPGTFTSRTAAAVAGIAPAGRAEIPSLLDSLVNRSLLVATRPAPPKAVTVFRQLASVRGHATEALRAADDEPATVASRADWVVALLQDRPRTGEADARGWFDEFDDNFAAVRATLQLCVVDEPAPLAGHILSRISNFWYYRTRMVEGGRWLELAAAHRAGADPTDARMVELSLAGSYGMRGRFDLARPLITTALEGLRAFPAARQADVVGHLTSLALAAALFSEFDVIDQLRDAVTMACDAYPGTDFAVVSDALACLADIRRVPPPVSVARAAEAYQRALDEGNLLAAWIACIVQTALSRIVGDPRTGLMWSDRMVAAQLGLGVRLEAMPWEIRAGYFAGIGAADGAVQLFAASQVMARRSGLVWPLQPTTQATLERIRTELGIDAYEESWRVGTEMTPEAALSMQPDA